jgi:YVTN family beta-propeller protein
MGIKKAAFIVTILLASIFAFSAASSVHAVELIRTVRVGDYPLGIAYDSGNGEIYVANSASDTVSVISDKNNTVVANIPVGVDPSGAAYDSAKGEIFVCNKQDNSVSIISDTNNAVIATVQVGDGPCAIAYDSGKGLVYVCNSGSNTVSVIADSTNAVALTIPVGSNPSGIAYDSGKGEIFVADFGNAGMLVEGAVSNSDTVSVISDATNTVIANITVGNSPCGMAYDPAKNEVFVYNSGGNGSIPYISVILDSNNTVIANLESVPVAPKFVGVPIANEPNIIGDAVSPNGGVVYDAGKGEIFVGDDAVYGNEQRVLAISDSNNSAVATVPVVMPMAMAYDSSKGEIFVTDSYYGYGAISDTVTVISDSPPLVAPSVLPSSGNVDLGQAITLAASQITTGVPPYTYQWFSEAPDASFYSLIGNATSPSYDFATSTSTVTGNWTFMLQVTDATRAAVNSTATQVTVNAPTPTPPPTKTVNGLGAEDLAVAAVAVILAAVVIVTLLLRKERTEKRKTKENQT